MPTYTFKAVAPATVIYTVHTKTEEQARRKVEEWVAATHGSPRIDWSEADISLAVVNGTKVLSPLDTIAEHQAATKDSAE